MSKKARQMPDGHHSFVELRGLWKQGAFTLEECITQLLHAAVRFETRRQQLELKMLPYQSKLETIETWQNYEATKNQTENQDLIMALEQDRKKAYEAMDVLLDQYATLELKFIQAERECEDILRELDRGSSRLN